MSAGGDSVIQVRCVEPSTVEECQPFKKKGDLPSLLQGIAINNAAPTEQRQGLAATAARSATPFYVATMIDDEREL